MSAPPLTPDQVRARYGWASLYPLHDRMRKGRIPHVLRKGERHAWFPLEWLAEYDLGCPLEVVELPDGGRVCRPKEATP